MKAVHAAVFALLAASGCTVVHDTGEMLGFACEWVEWKPMDPASPSAPRPASAGPDDETCYVTWAERGRVVLASRGDEADEISCQERDDSSYTVDDPLVVRPGQIAWIYGTYSDSPRVQLVLSTCAQLDAWIEDGGTPGEFAADRLEKSDASH